MRWTAVILRGLLANPELQGVVDTVPSSAFRGRVTIVVPTYKEAENLPLLIERVGRVREAHGLDIDMLIMDDDSRDGSVEVVAARPEKWVQLIVRTTDRGLSPARTTLSKASSTSMLRKLDEGADFVIGSRYVAGGSTSDDWGFLRWLNSRMATLLARPFTAAKDPMAGYFALRRSTFEAGREFNPIGYKIGLELLIKCDCERVVEVPIHFEDRRLGESKLTLKQQLLYLRHLRRLYVFKYGVWTQLLQFLTVGALGTLVNLVLLTLFLAVGLSVRPAVAAAILLSMCFNFALNRRFSFSAARGSAWPRQLLAFVAASSVGALINYATTLFVLARAPAMRPQLAALIGIVVGTAFNFLQRA